MITDTMVYQNTPSGGVVDQENKLDKPRKPHVVFMLGACLIIAALFVAFSFRSTYLPNSQTNTDVIPLPDSSQQIDAPLADFSTNISGSDKKIVYIKDGDAFIYDLENSHVVKLTESGYVSDVRLSPDSSKVAYLEIPTSVVSTGNVQKMPGSGIFHTPLSYGDYENIRDLFVVSSTGSNQVKINIGEMARRTVAWSPISNKIVYEEEGRIVEYDLLLNTSTIFGQGIEPVYSPDGRRTAYISADEQTVHIWQGEIIDEYTHHEKIADLTWPLNDTLFFSSLGNADEGPTFNWEFSIWSYRLGDEARQITTTSSRIHTPFVSPDGNWALASKGSGYADAGHIDLSMVVLNLKNDSIDSKEIQWQDFEGSDLSEDMTSSMFLYGTPVWLDNTSVLVHLDHLMDNQPNLKGIYKLDIDTSSIERILEL